MEYNLLRNIGSNLNVDFDSEINPIENCIPGIGQLVQDGSFMVPLHHSQAK